MFEVISLSGHYVCSETPSTSTDQNVSHECIEPALLQVVLTHRNSFLFIDSLLGIDHAVTPLPLHLFDLGFQCVLPVLPVLDLLYLLVQRVIQLADVSLCVVDILLVESLELEDLLAKF